MKKSWAGLLMMMLSGVVTAQSRFGSDSIFFYRQYQSANEFSFLSGGLLQANDDPSYGMVSLGYSHVEGDFRRAQQAYVRQTVNFYTSGFRDMGKVKLAGRFSFGKQWDDSLNNTMKGLDDDLASYYYFAGKHAPYERQNYRMSALGTYAVNPKFYIALMAAVRTHWTTRSLDPRPDVKSFDLRLHPELVYCVSGHTFSGGYIWGKGDEENSLEYKNPNFQWSLLYPDRIHYINQGFGFISLRDSSTLRRFRSVHGAFASYEGEIGATSANLLAKWQRTREENSHDLKTRKTYQPRTIFTLDDYQGKLLLTRNENRDIRQTALQFRYRTGYDYSNIFKGRNYRTDCLEASAGYRYRWNSANSLQLESGISVFYRSSSKEDAAAAHLLRQRFIEPAVSVDIYYTTSSGNWLSLLLKPAYRFSLETTLSVPPTQENIFSKGVVYPDFYYFGSNAALMQGEVTYVNRVLLQQTSVGVSAKVSHAFRTGSNAVVRSTGKLPAAFVPDGHRFWAEFGIYLYL